MNHFELNELHSSCHIGAVWYTENTNVNYNEQNFCY